ncbi:hypothetical protein [Neochlamydia sp. S13]|uniref:hypothetical protein n=1 Tax=Neochlamydia sp. S13 TaxID=1353976 RepID=UPI0005A7C015|nr:hypothetical protein [Neochlamydia sp. S13]BBI18122.1 hypothetical protein NCS13_1_1927 [Neochlamydia sp. S13]
MHFISLGSDGFSAFLLFKGNIKKLKKQVKPIRIDLRKGGAFQAFRSSHRFWRLSDTAIMI